MCLVCVKKKSHYVLKKIALLFILCSLVRMSYECCEVVITQLNPV